VTAECCEINEPYPLILSIIAYEIPFDSNFLNMFSKIQQQIFHIVNAFRWVKGAVGKTLQTFPQHKEGISLSLYNSQTLSPLWGGNNLTN
jgi:hypothetical protein